MHSMADEPPTLVSAGIILKGDRILICQRHRTDPYGLQWEFPGGKVLEGEALEDSLKRELAEELSIEVDVGDEVFRLRHRYPDRYVEVVFFSVSTFRGKIQNQVFESIVWAPRSQLLSYTFLEADQGLVQRIANGEIV